MKKHKVKIKFEDYKYCVTAWCSGDIIKQRVANTKIGCFIEWIKLVNECKNFLSIKQVIITPTELEKQAREIFYKQML